MGANTLGSRQSDQWKRDTMMETDGGMAALLVSDAIEVGRLYIHQGRPRLFYENKKQKKQASRCYQLLDC